MPSTLRWPTALVAALLFGSGFCALAYQVVWFREFRLVFGASTAASAAVLAIFMGGIGLGGAILGRKADTYPSPLRLYGWLELGIAVAAGLSPLLVYLSQLAYTATGGQLVMGLLGATVARLALACVVLGVPTFLMGGTLPAAVRAATRDDDRFRHATALLYGINTLGAVLGAALTTFLFLPAMSTHAVLWLACGLNVLIGLSAVVLGPRVEEARTQAGRQAAVAAVPLPRGASGETAELLAPEPAGLVYAAAGIVGFAFFLMELVWYRMLGPILGGTTYTFGLILAVALFGIGIGGALCSIQLRRIRPTLSGFALTCGLEALCIAVPFALGDRVALWAYDFRAAAESFAGQVFGWFVICGIVVLPAAIVAGVQFPLLIALAGRGRTNVGRHVGMTYAWNTLGAIVGSLAGGFGLLPLLTAPGAWVAVVVLLAALCLATLVQSLRARQGWPVSLPAGAAAAAAVLLVFAYEGPTAVWRHSGIGAGRATIDRASPNATLGWIHGTRRGVIWEAEGVEASVALRAADGLAFYLNGKIDGNATRDAATQIMLGMLPALLHGEARSAMVIGMGTGETAGWLAETPTIERVNVVELERAIDEVAIRCGPVNHNVMQHPKVRCIYNDGREVLLTSRERYDIIASAPSNPYRAGISSMYTHEFYEAARNRLNEGGLFTKWLQGYEVTEATVRLVCATLMKTFSHVEIWQTQEGDLLLVCSMSPPRYNAEQLQENLRHEHYRSAIAAAWNVADLEGVLARFVANAEYVRQFAAPARGQENTDARNRIEYMFAQSLGQQTRFSIEQMKQAAGLAGADRPMNLVSGVDWDRVAAQRQWFRWMLEGDIVPIPDSSAEQAARTEVLRYYAAKDPVHTTTTWEQAGYGPLFPGETINLAVAYAVQGNERARMLAQELEPFRRADALGVLACLATVQEKYEEAADRLIELFTLLRSSPWISPQVAETVFGAATELSRQPEFAPRLWSALREPFSVYALDPDRRTVAGTAAQYTGPEATFEYLKSSEPFVPWNPAYLEFRLQVYERLGSPLASRARRDLAAYRANE
ncbi:MAG: fused MFS/spermidine synthase [Planctomycetota bacterium]